MDYPQSPASERTFATPELLEHILTFLLCQLLRLTDQEDPRSVKIRGNAIVLRHLLRCSEVGRGWNQCIIGSKRLQRALFLLPDHNTTRSWDLSTSITSAPHARQLYSYSTAPYLRAPQLNPIIQTTFSAYHFRFWHLSLENTGNKHCAYLIVTRRDLPAVGLRQRTGQGKNVSDMLLSQPPSTALEATIWEERDETKDHAGHTSALKDPVIECEEGITIGLVHKRVCRLFDDHRDVMAIKLTTL